MIQYFILGFFIGGIIGLFLMALITTGKITDLENEIDELKYQLFGKKINNEKER